MTMNALVVITSACVLCATVTLAGPQKGTQNDHVAKEDREVQAMKASDAWAKMEEQLSQYETHYTQATNQIAQVTDTNTRQALTKSLKAVDDCKDALVKLIRCFHVYVEALE